MIANAANENYKAGDRINQFLSLLNWSLKLCVAICVAMKSPRKRTKRNNLKLWFFKSVWHFTGIDFKTTLRRPKQEVVVTLRHKFQLSNCCWSRHRHTQKRTELFKGLFMRERIFRVINLWVKFQAADHGKIAPIHENTREVECINFNWRLIKTSAPVIDFKRVVKAINVRKKLQNVRDTNAWIHYSSTGWVKEKRIEWEDRYKADRYH